MNWSPGSILAASVAVLTAAGVYVGLANHTPEGFSIGASSQERHAPSADEDPSVAATAASDPTSSSEIVPEPDAPSMEPSEPVAPAGAEGLAALALPPGDLGTGASVTGGTRASVWTPSEYAAESASTSITPVACAEASGLLVMRSRDESSSMWNTPSIVRVHDLRLERGSIAGWQELRRFTSPSEANLFMAAQRDWFRNCSEVDYQFASGKQVHFSGRVEVDDASTSTESAEVLLTSAANSGGNSDGEFDGWVRVGSIVYAAQLLSDTLVTRADLVAAGESLIAAAKTNLQNGP